MKKTFPKRIAGVRVAGRVSVEDDKRLAEWAGKLGMTKSQMIGLSVHTGMNWLITAISPEQTINTEVVKQAVERMVELNLAVKGD